MILFVAATVSFLSLLVTWLRRELLRTLALRNAVKRYGCQIPRQYPHRLPFGIDLQQERLKSRQDGRYNAVYHEQFQKYGQTWTETLGATTVINTIEPENFKQVATCSSHYRKVPMRSKALSPLLGNGIFTQDGPDWKFSRNLITPLFVRAQISEIDSFKDHVDAFLSRISGDGTTVDLQPSLHRLFSNASVEFIFGDTDASADVSFLERQHFTDAFNQALDGAGRRAQLGPLRFVYWWDERDWRQACAEVHEFVDRRVALALARTGCHEQHGSKEEPEKASRKYILLQEMAKRIRDPIALRFQILGVFMPARDTTSIAVSNALFNLARHPSVWTELRSRALALGDQPLTFEIVHSLDCFKHVIFESLRLQGPAGRIARMATQDTMLPRGGGLDGASPVFVPKGTIVGLHTYAKNHSRRLWGDDSEEFDPHRWMKMAQTGEGSADSQQQQVWDFTPFGSGPRVCPARQQALTQSIYILVRLVTAFARIENRDPVLGYVESTKMGSESRNGVKVALYVS